MWLPHVKGTNIITSTSELAAEPTSCPSDFTTYENLTVKEALVPRLLKDQECRLGLFVLITGIGIRAPAMYR